MRGEGATTKQMMDAPQGAFYLWCNDNMAYPRNLAHSLQRDDLRVMPLSWLRYENLAMSRHIPLVVDHAAGLTRLQKQYVDAFNRG